MDFYINEYNIALEIDGGHHADKKMQINDQIKNVLMCNDNMHLLRF